MKKPNRKPPLAWMRRAIPPAWETGDKNARQAAFPAMPESFDQRVRATLANLPDRSESPAPVATDTTNVPATAIPTTAVPTATRKPRRAFRLAATIGLAATLCVGMTAVAANVRNWFPTLLKNPPADLVSIPEPTVVSNDDYELALEALTYDEAAGTALVSVRLTDKKQTGVAPFAVARVPLAYQQKDMAWTQLAECYGCRGGELLLNLLYHDTDACFGKFYLNETRSTDNVYYLEGAFVLGERYTPGTPLRLEAETIMMDSQGGYDMDAMAAANLTLPLPVATTDSLPCVKSADGSVILSEIGLHIVNNPAKGTIYDPADTLDTCLVDALDTIELQWKDGTSWTILDEAAHVSDTLYALGESSGAEGYDIATYLLARTVDCTQVQAIVLNGKVFPLS